MKIKFKVFIVFKKVLNLKKALLSHECMYDAESKF